MSFVFNEAEFKKESEEFYSTYPADVSEIENELNQRYEKEKVSYRAAFRLFAGTEGDRLGFTRRISQLFVIKCFSLSGVLC